MAHPAWRTRGKQVGVTAYQDVFLSCNYPRCPAEFRADPDFGFPVASVVRREARKAGWKTVRSHLGRRYDEDYCPEHDADSAHRARQEMYATQNAGQRSGQ